ncbi:hypothetical protein G7Y89_g12363 [Cudoniella acicularis]|uniref:Topoisomerase 1-associated factor 1 n=1 Tax=Cudoniella acicularis TaxID=354080 RepID=A0A8H4VZQ7_9HELO|nr:hypothetical protein G7Y89_g12363 [Cudoniella acicularis]
MELANGQRDVVDPEVRAYVSSLVTALGGSGADEDGRYVLGDDALACLRDLKKWLKLYDEKANRLDVARCLAESNLVGGDLLQILATWPENATEDRLKSKIALACLELLVPLTWPLDKDPQQMTVNHHRHIPYLEIAQLGYKRSIINYDGARILHTAVRSALPSMAEAMGDRSARDEGIIKLLLYFLRNITMIAPPPNVQYEGDEAEISRSATIDAFDYQDIFQLLLTLSSTMGEDFNTQDVVVLDVLFHLIKGVDIEKLFLDEKSAANGKMDELVRLRQKEAAMLRVYQANAPTRHNRFGAMAWIQREDSKRSTISGQAAVTDSARGLAQMDTNKHLRAFVEEFLDAGFNPLFNHIRKAIDREAERILLYHPRQFFYLVSWLLEAERVRRKSKKAAKGNMKTAPEELDSFSLVASVLTQEMFVTLNRAMDTSFENKSWQDLSAAMKCFTQILLTVQEMSESPLEEDQEIAENILNRIFYEETTHDRVANITRTYKDQGFGYLDSCTELAHNYLRILEQYSKQNVDLQVRSRRRVRRKKKAAKAAGEGDASDDAVDESEGEDEAKAERTSHERKFDFKRFAARFVSQGCVDTFVTFTAFYNDLKPSQLKRAHRFFYRVAFKQDMSVMLFRVDIIALFHKMVKGPEGLDPQASYFKEWDEFTNGTAHYLEYGYEKQTVTTKPRPAAELEVKPGIEIDEQIGIVVSALLDRNEGEHIQWVKSQISIAEQERRSWEAMNTALQPTEDDPFETPTEPAELPKAPSIYQLKQSLDLIKKAEFSPPTFDDGQEAGDFIRRASAGTAAKKRAVFDDEDNGIDDDEEEEEFMFPAGGPTAMKKSDALEALKKKRRRRRREGSEEAGVDDEILKARAEARRLRELEKNRKIKSDLFVHSSDDEIDNERDRAFFEAEERLREKSQMKFMKELLKLKDDSEKTRKRPELISDASGDDDDLPVVTKSKKSRKRPSSAISNDNDGESGLIPSGHSSSTARDDNVLDESENETTDTPISSPHIRSSQPKKRKVVSDDEASDEEIASVSNVAPKSSAMNLDADDEEDDVPVVRPARQRVRAGFIMDSSDEE